MNYLDIIAPAITIIAVACYISQIITRLERKLSTVTAQRDKLAEALEKVVTACYHAEWLDENDFESFRKRLQSLTPKAKL